MNNVFVNLVRGNTLKTYLGLEGEVNKDYKFSSDYSYIECNLGQVTVLDDKSVVLKPAVSIDPKKCKVVVVANAKLSAFGSISYQSILERGEGKSLGIRLDSVDADLTKIDWLCRLYVIYG